MMYDDIDLADPNPQGDPGEMQRRMGMLGPPQQPGQEFLDRIEGDMAVLMTGEGQERNVPVANLPPGAKEGDTISMDDTSPTSLYGNNNSDASTIINSLYGMPR
jgi:hypothetical protein